METTTNGFTKKEIDIFYKSISKETRRRICREHPEFSGMNLSDAYQKFYQRFKGRGDINFIRYAIKEEERTKQKNESEKISLKKMVDQLSGIGHA